MNSKKKTYYLEDYNQINSSFGENKKFNFMNHGYFPVHPNCTDLFFDTCGSMYCNLADKFGEVKNKNILDIGCGRGGGTKLLRKFYDFSEVFGCDLNEKNIEFCKLDTMGCSFNIDDAEYLGKYKDNFFDFIINIESAHCYDDLNKFFNSVKRILKKDGVFIIADIIAADPNDASPHYLAIIAQHFEIKEVINLTSNVEESCKYLFQKISKENIENKGNDLWKKILIDKIGIYANRKCYFLASVLQKKYNQR